MLIPKAAKRYAQALYTQASDKGVLENVLKDSQLIGSIVNESRELQVFLKNQIISKQKKRDVLDNVFSGSVSETTHSLINLLLEKSREDQLGSVAKAFIDTYNLHHGIVVAEVRHAKELDQKQVDALKKALEQRTGKTVDLKFIEDPSLIGGLTIKMGDTVIDGSVKNKIHKLDALFHGTAA